MKQSYLLLFEMTMIGRSGFVGYVTFSKAADGSEVTY